MAGISITSITSSVICWKRESIFLWLHIRDNPAKDISLTSKILHMELNMEEAFSLGNLQRGVIDAVTLAVCLLMSETPPANTPLVERAESSHASLWIWNNCFLVAMGMHCLMHACMASKNAFSRLLNLLLSRFWKGQVAKNLSLCPPEEKGV